MSFLVDDLISIKQKIDYYKFFTELGMDLKPSGNNLWALCPFHKDSNPSWQFNLETKTWVCWNESLRGDIFDFLQKFKHISFQDAVFELAEYVGIEIQIDEEVKQKNELRKKLFDFNKKLCLHFIDNFKDSKKAQDYMASRGFNNQSIKDFGIGYYDPSKIRKFLKGQDVEICLMNGIVKKNKDDKIVLFSPHDRIILPYTEGRNIASFTSRVLDDTLLPKYQNFANNLFITKDKLVYGLTHAKPHIKKYGKCVTVEGNLDVVRAHQEGIKNVIAVSGTKMTEQQVIRLKQYAKEFIQVLEDENGMSSPEKKFLHLDNTYETLKKEIPFVKMKVVKLFKDSSKTDLDEYLKTHSAGEFINLVNTAPTHNEFKFKYLLEGIKIKDIEDKKKYIYLAREHLLNIPNRIDRDEYYSLVSHLIDYPEDKIRKLVEYKEQQQYQYTATSIDKNVDSITNTTQKGLLCLLLSKFDTKTVFGIFTKHQIQELLSHEYAVLYTEIIDLISSGYSKQIIIDRLSTEPRFKDLFIDVISKLDIVEQLDESRLEDIVKSQIKYLQT